LKDGVFNDQRISDKLCRMRVNDFTKILRWPGYRVYQSEIDEKGKTLRLRVRRKRGNRKLICSGCGRKFTEAHDCREREVRDLPWGEFRTTVVIEVYRVCCPNCGVKIEKVPPLPSKAPFSQRFEEAVGVDEIYFGKQMKFITVVSNLETGEPLWFGRIASKKPWMSFFIRN
jgi:transposase